MFMFIYIINDRNLRGKYIIDYDTLIGMVKSCLPELYMPMFLKLLYNFNQQQNVRNKKIIGILDNDNIPIENKHIMLRELDRISNFNDKKVIKRYKNSYDENEKIMVECEELLLMLN